METKDPLIEVEKRAYRSTFEDGLYDILWGGIFLLFAWIPILENIGISRFYSYPSILILGLIPWLGKRYVTIPRMGEVEFGEKRRARKRYTALIGLAAIVLMLPVMILMFANGFHGGLTWKTVAIIIAPLIAFGVFLMDYPRIYLYAILFLFSVASTDILFEYFGSQSITLVTFGVPGAAIVGYGFFLLFKFLKEYPKPAAEATDVSR